MDEKREGPPKVEPDQVTVEAQAAALELVRWAINTGSIAKFISIPGVRAEGLSMGSWEITVRRIE